MLTDSIDLHDASVPSSLREKYQQTLGYVALTLEQQASLVDQHRADEQQWRAEREALRDQITELSSAFTELKAAALAEQRKMHNLQAAKAEAQPTTTISRKALSPRAARRS